MKAYGEKEMTYKTRQEVLRAAADWMDVCEKAEVTARYRHMGIIGEVQNAAFGASPFEYEFPLALLEGKEVWVGSELWNVPNNFKFTANAIDFLDERRRILDGKGRCGWIKDCSWNPPKPATVMVEMPIKAAKYYAQYDLGNSVGQACKKALEKL